jgi:hypothetical protein
MSCTDLAPEFRAGGSKSKQKWQRSKGNAQKVKAERGEGNWEEQQCRQADESEMAPFAKNLSVNNSLVLAAVTRQMRKGQVEAVPVPVRSMFSIPTCLWSSNHKPMPNAKLCPCVFGVLLLEFSGHAGYTHLLNTNARCGRAWRHPCHAFATASPTRLYSHHHPSEPACPQAQSICSPRSGRC